jgi:opacity protein-like surface antigen
MLIGAPKLLAKGTSMKLRSIALVLAVALVSAAAHAQSGVYLTMDAQQFTQEGVDLPAFPNSADIDRPWLYGPGYGVYYDVTHLPYLGKLKTGPVVFGIDARGDTLRLSEYHSTFNRQDGLFSIRVAPRNKFKGLTPYIQGGFGIGHTKVPFRNHYSNNFNYQFSIGVDRKLKNHIDWRVVEASAGSLANYATGYYPAGVGPNQSNYTVTLATGLVFRIK